MVQREIADRLRAEPGAATYGSRASSSSSPARSSCCAGRPRGVQPRPRVDSALLRLRRRGPAAPDGAGDAGARRSPTAASRWRARSSWRADPSRDAAREALGDAGLADDARAEALAPADFVALAERCEVGDERDPARARRSSTSACTWARGATTGLHEICSLFEPLELADESWSRGGAEDEVVCEGSRPEPAATALAALRERGWEQARRCGRDREADPGRGRAWAAAAPTRRPCCGLARGEVEGLAVDRRRDRRRRPLAARAPRLPGRGRRRGDRAGPAARGARGGPGPQAGGLATAEVYAEADRLGLWPRPAELEAIGAASATPPARRLAARLPPSCSSTTSQPAALSLRPEIEGALAALREAGAAQALVTGSGPTAFGLFRHPRGAAADAAAA